MVTDRLKYRSILDLESKKWLEKNLEKKKFDYFLKSKMSSQQFTNEEKLILESMFNGWKLGLCEFDINYSIDAEIRFLNQQSDNQHLIKKVFDESYEGTNDIRYRIETQDYYTIDSDEEEESDEESDEEL